MIGFGRQDAFRRRLKMAHDALPRNAEQRGEQACCKSGQCCWSGPCQLSPTDPPKIAAHLGITEAQLFAEYLVVDESKTKDYSKGWWAWTSFRVMPRRREWEGGHFLTDDETYDVNTPCVFLTVENGCRIHTAKPAGGMRYKCWDKSTHGEAPDLAWTEEQVMALGWDGYRSDGD